MPAAAAGVHPAARTSSAVGEQTRHPPPLACALRRAARWTRATRARSATSAPPRRHSWPGTPRCRCWRWPGRTVRHRRRAPEASRPPASRQRRRRHARVPHSPGRRHRGSAAAPCPAGALSFCHAGGPGRPRLAEDSKVHRSRVTCLAWAPGGELLVSADERGMVRGLRWTRAWRAHVTCVARCPPPEGPGAAPRLRGQRRVGVLVDPGSTRRSIARGSRAPGWEVARSQQGACTLRARAPPAQVALWRADAEMRPVLAAQAELPKARVTHAVFAGSSSGSGSGSGSGMQQVFFAAAADQACSIRALDETGKCSVVQVGRRGPAAGRRPSWASPGDAARRGSLPAFAGGAGGAARAGALPRASPAAGGHLLRGGAGAGARGGGARRLGGAAAHAPRHRQRLLWRHRPAGGLVLGEDQGGLLHRGAALLGQRREQRHPLARAGGHRLLRACPRRWRGRGRTRWPAPATRSGWCGCSTLTAKTTTC
jgi:hypothetical protein